MFQTVLRNAALKPKWTDHRWTLRDGPLSPVRSLVVSTVAQNLRQQRSRRPGSVWPASVPSAFGQVISPGHVRKSTQAGTCPLWTSDSPTTLTCMLTCIRAWPASLCRGVPLTGFSPAACSRRGRGAHYKLRCRLLPHGEAVRSRPELCAVANATRDETSGAHSPRR